MLKKIIALLCLQLCLSNPSFADTKTQLWETSDQRSLISVDHSQWQAILDKYVGEHESGINSVDYAKLQSTDDATLKSYLLSLQKIDPLTLNKDEQFAFWVNLYNAATVSLIIDNYPLKSIREIKDGLISFGPWEIEWIKVGDQVLSLDDIEHEILRPIWQDSRIHYAVNCASISCPNLSKTAFTPSNTQDQLNRLATDYINHPRGVQIERGRLKLSSIYDWYNPDFRTDDSDLIDHLIEFAKPTLKAQLIALKKTSFSHGYDWNLNDRK
jgi:hypothetical protein